VTSAAYTSRLGKFVNSVCSSLNIEIGAGERKKERQEYQGVAEQILNSGNDKDLLKLLRDETKLLVLMVRVRNQERQEEWEEKQAKKEAERQAEEDAMNDPLFGLPEGVE
jgi:hypothetical protein